jgi:hypothetical protein
VLDQDVGSGTGILEVGAVGASGVGSAVDAAADTDSSGPNTTAAAGVGVVVATSGELGVSGQVGPDRERANSFMISFLKDWALGPRPQE